MSLIEGWKATMPPKKAHYFVVDGWGYRSACFGLGYDRRLLTPADKNKCKVCAKRAPPTPEKERSA